MDLRSSTLAYPAGVVAPAAIGFDVSLLGLPPALFTAAALGVLRVAVAGVLDADVNSMIQVRAGEGTPVVHCA